MTCIDDKRMCYDRSRGVTCNDYVRKDVLRQIKGRSRGCDMY